MHVVHRFLWAKSPSCHQTNSVEALIETKSIHPMLLMSVVDIYST